MSTALNDRDAILQAASVRIINPKNASILMSASSSLFHLNAAGAVDVAETKITATLIGLEGDVTFTVDGAVLTSVTGQTAVVRYIDMQGPTAIVTARIVAGGQTFSQSCIIGVVRDGTNGSDGGSGARGAGMYFASGNAWSDGTADAATPGGNVLGDVVTISNGGTYAMTKRWDGAGWLVMGAIFDGSLFVTGSIHGAAIRAGTMDILAPDGTIILKASSSLAEQTKSSPNLAARLSSWGGLSGGASIATNSADARFTNGEFLRLPAGSSYTGAASNPLNIQPNAYYTVSFDAYCVGASRFLSANLYGAGLDTAGKGVQLTNTIARYSFSDRMPDFGSAPKGWLRIFAVSAGGEAVISNVKVELGAVGTAWTDDLITPGNASTRVLPDSINNTMIGGDLFSTNWNGIVGPGGAGWLMRRSGDLYASSVYLRGQICSGSFVDWNWPAPGQRGWFVGGQGAKWGNYNDGRFVQIGEDGNMYMPGFKHEGGQLTLDRPIIINPQLNAKTASIRSTGGTYFTAGRNNPSAYMGNHVMDTAGLAAVRYAWTVSYDAPPAIFSARPSSDGNSSTTVNAAVNAVVGQAFDVRLTCTAFDAGGLSVSAMTVITLEIT